VVLDIKRIDDGEKYEEVRSLNQDLMFVESGLFFAAKEISFALDSIKRCTCKQQTAYIPIWDCCYPTFGTYG